MRRNRIEYLVPKWQRKHVGHLIKDPRKRFSSQISDDERAARIIRLSKRDVRKVLTLLGDPPKPNQRLKDAVKMFEGTVRK